MAGPLSSAGSKGFDNNFVMTPVDSVENSELSPEDVKLCEEILGGRSLPLVGDDMPRAHSGDTRVYFPPQAPNCILKMSGETKLRSSSKDGPFERLSKMNFARQLCKTNNLSDLVIPRASVSQDREVLFEQRMNFNNYDVEQERLAVVHSQAQAIRQFTKFVLLTGMWDLHLDRYSNSPHYWARFDNFPLMEKREANQSTLQIALIDLERIETTAKKIHFQLLPKLVYVFPHSFELIMEEARAVGLTNGLTDKERDKISKWHKRGLVRSDYFHKNLVHYCEKKKSGVAGIKFLTSEMKNEIINKFADEKSIKEQNKPLLVKCFESFFESLEELDKDETCPSSIFGEKSITINTASFRKTNEAIAKLVREENKDKSYSDKNYLEINQTQDFFKIMQEKGVVYSAYNQGFRVFIIL